MKKNRSLNLAKVNPTVQMTDSKLDSISTPAPNIYQLIFKNSLFANILSDNDGKIIETNHAASKLFGFTEEELVTIGMTDIFSISKTEFKSFLKKQTRAKTKSQLTATKKNGKKIQCEISSVVFTDDQGQERALNIIVDVRRRSPKQLFISNKSGNALSNKKPDLENQILENNERLHGISISYDVILDWNIFSNEVFFGNAFEELFGYKMQNNIGTLNHLTDNIHPEDKEAFEHKLYMALESGEMSWEDEYRFIRADGLVANVNSRAIIKRTIEGKAYRMIGAMQDVSKRKELEEKLEQELRAKEMQLTEAIVATHESVRSEIGMELHDNVNQLLGVTKLYLELAKRDKKNRDNFLNQCSIFTLNAIEEIRKLSKRWISPEIKDMVLFDAIKNIVRDIMEVHPVIIIFKATGFNEKEINGKFKLNVFRIVQEQLNNILKHAKASEIRIDLSQNKNEIILSISDDGIGFDTTKTGKGVGLSNIISRAKLFKGTADFLSNLKKGCALILTFPITESILNK